LVELVRIRIWVFTPHKNTLYIVYSWLKVLSRDVNFRKMDVYYSQNNFGLNLYRSIESIITK